MRLKSPQSSGVHLVTAFLPQAPKTPFPASVAQSSPPGSRASLLLARSLRWFFLSLPNLWNFISLSDFSSCAANYASVHQAHLRSSNSQFGGPGFSPYSRLLAPSRDGVFAEADGCSGLAVSRASTASLGDRRQRPPACGWVPSHWLAIDLNEIPIFNCLHCIFLRTPYSIRLR